MEFTSRLLDTSGFVPRGEAAGWSRELLWLHNAADVMIWLAFVAIPVVIFYFVRHRADMPFPLIFWLFGAFILGTGMTHFMEAVTSYKPMYRLSGTIKVVTAVTSWATVLALASVIPKALRLRSSDELEREIAERRRSEQILRRQTMFLQLLQEVTGAINDAATVEEAMQVCLRCVCQHINWPVGHVYFAEAHSEQELTCTTLWHSTIAEEVNKIRQAAGAGTPVAAGEGLPGQVFASGKPAWVSDVRDDPNFHRKALARTIGARAALAFPVLAGKEVAAVLEFFSTQPLEPDEPLLEVMAQIGTQLGRVIERRRAAEALQKSEMRFRSVTLSANAAIVSADSHSNVVSWNRGAESTFGYSEEEILGKPLTLLMPERYRQRHEAGLRQSQAGGELSRLKPIEFHGLRKDGTEFPLELSLSSWQTDEGTFHTGIIQDITARKQAEEEVHRLNARMREWIRDVEDANRELEAFSYSVSHDLRAPLRALDGYSRMALESLASQPTDESRRYLELIRKNAQQMGHLIDDLLNFSRLGRQSLTMQPVAVGDVVRRVLNDLRSECEGRCVDISLGKLPPCRADQALLRQVYANLVGNALKYTRHKDKAVIEIGSLPANGEPDKQVYFVRDNGVGFDMDYAGKLFGVFQRLHRAEDYEGTGVGLATVKRIVQRHGGRIWAVAAVNAGATFFFTLQQESAA